MVAHSYGVGRYVAGERDVLWRPRMYKGDGTVPGIVYSHGAGELAHTPQNPLGNKPNEERLFRKIVEAGWPMVCCDFGVGNSGTTSTDHWGGPNGQTRFDQAITWLQSASGGGAKPGPVFILAISMGNLLMLNYAKANPTKVLAMAGMLPAVDLDDIRNNNKGGYRAAIDGIWGVTYPAALPAGANPTTDHSGAVGIPTWLAYASDDAICDPTSVTTIGASLGADLVNLGALGHTDAAIGAVNPDDIINHFAAAA